MRAMICDICGRTENDVLFDGGCIRSYKRIVYKSTLMGTRLEYEDAFDICESCIKHIREEIRQNERK